MKIKSRLLLVAITTCSTLFIGWGNVGHRIINTRTILSITPSMSFWGSWSDSLSAHGSDADYRKSNDPTEAPKHYIDIDNYPEFISNGYVSQSFDSLVSQHGYSFVMDQGILPWAILNTFDSLQIAFQNNQFHKAMLLAADLGHYIGDMHMPLHLTRNYDGQFTGQSGIHGKFESNMINTYSSQIVYSGDSLTYINDVSAFVFDLLYINYSYVDSVLKSDSLATAFAGNRTSTAYYSKMWEVSKGFTTKLFKDASNKLTCLIYSAWINAGSPVSVEDESTLHSPVTFNLLQNYPNPFNSTTKISWQSPISSQQTLKVYDVLGNEVATLIDEYKTGGSYEVNFIADGLSSGIYFYKLQVGSFIETKKMILLR